MSFVELFLLAVGVSMDAFSVSICKGLSLRKMRWDVALVLGLAFGGFQAFMPLIGYFLGSQLMWLIEPIDHWVAFILLAIIGGNMIREALGEEEEEEVGEFERLDLKEVLLLAVATSIDALSVGVAFASLKVNIWLSVALIGVTTFCFSVAGVAIGCAFGSRFERPAQITGGVILILIGLKVLFEDLGLIAF